MAAVTNFLTKALSPSYYTQTYKQTIVNAYNYYHPLFRSGSGTPLFHMMIGTSLLMYSTTYYSRDYKNMQHKHVVEKEAMKEYYEKHGGSPDHH